MQKVLRFAIVALFVVVSAAAFGQSEVTGQTSGGAYYRMLVPDGWQPANGLVIWNHGFDLSPIAPNPDLGPLVNVQLSQGFAVIASSYSLTGWALFESGADLEEMVQAFERGFGVPSQVFVYGASLGGIVTAQAIEKANLGNVVGAMPICGAVGGSRIWDGGVDVRLLYDALCSEVPGANIPGGANGLPFPPDPNFDQNALGFAVNTCFGVLQPPDTRTADQAARLAKLLEVTGLPENFVLTDMGFSTFGLADLVYDPRKLAGGMAFDNANVMYGDADIDATIARIQPDPNARQKMVDNYTPTGKVGDVKIVSLHTDKDGLVIIENENQYASVVPGKNLTTAIVVEAVPSHCGFTEAEVVASWESLRGWVAGLPQPGPADIQAACLAIEAGGLADGPCRIDPNFEIPDLDGRVRPRDVCVEDQTTLCLGEDGRFRVRTTWEDFGGRMGQGRTFDFSGSTGAFYFFNDENLDLTVKLLDGRQNNGEFWVFFGSLTNVEFSVTITDTENGLSRVYDNPSGNFSSVGDTNAF